jgi:uncharacterized protein involved in exopolysaccharide biosynthesis
MKIENPHLRAGGSLSARVVVEALFRQKRLFLGLFASVLLLVIAVTLVSKKQYKSEMKFLVENMRSQAVITPDRSSSAPVSDVNEQQINSELEVLQSQDVLQAVADPDWASKPIAKHTPEEIRAHELKLSTLARHLHVDPVRKSNVISVTYTAPSPQLATESLQQLSAAYLSHRKQLSRPSGTSNFFKEEAKRYQDVWQKANGELVAFQQQNHLVSVPDVEDALSKQIASEEEDLRANDSSLRETERRLSESEKALNTLPARQQTAQRTISNQYSIEQMRTLLVTLGNRRTELLTRYKPTDRLVLEVEREIADTNAALNTSLAERGSEDTTDVNPAWQSMKSTMLEERVNREAMLSKGASMRRDIVDLHGQLSRLQSLAVQFNGLQEQADQARSNFELFSEKRDQAQIEDAMDERKLINIAVAESPTSLFQPVAPKPLLNAVLGALTALFLAAGAVYFAESSRNTIAAPRELDALSRHPVLATIPMRRLDTEAATSDSRREGVVSRMRDPLAGPMTLLPAMRSFRKANDL